MTNHNQLSSEENSQLNSEHKEFVGLLKVMEEKTGVSAKDYNSLAEFNEALIKALPPEAREKVEKLLGIEGDSSEDAKKAPAATGAVHSSNSSSN